MASLSATKQAIRSLATRAGASILPVSSLGPMRAATSSRLLHSSFGRAATYGRFKDGTQPLSLGWQRNMSSSQSAGREQLSGDQLRRQLEEQLFRRIGQGAQGQSRSQQKPVQYQRFGGGGGGGGTGRRGWRLSRPPVLVLIALGGGGVYYVTHLEQVPETDRWRFIDVSPEQEHEMGKQSLQQILSEYRDRVLPASHPYSKHVRAVASRIVAALDKAVDSSNQPMHTKGDPNLTHHSHGQEGGISYGQSGSGSASWFGGQSEAPAAKPATQWEVYVIDDPKQKNAFVLPGGKIFVFTGILPICQNADGLATVLGHEVAHQVARHSAEKMSGYKVLGAASLLLDALGLDIGLSRTALTLLMELPNSRTAESEADYLGLRIMSRACFDPREASKLWTRMTESEGDGGKGILGSAQAVLSTHPMSSKRIKNMEKWLPEAMDTRNASNCPAPQQVDAFRSAANQSRQSLPF
ncbi:hypothetical protein PaG_02803 [Moesziomyces aphidis]|uniref:Peptidase M48 domain-containing protein n=1 Tax=Moesziomyces aphidis TaxID=84754 RepID=W3VN83_MOEAP|nr:hypothetical protein PaG_02803 [Moesziomyces aphidis]